jgi:hypothetical protein
VVVPVFDVSGFAEDRAGFRFNGSGFHRSVERFGAMEAVETQTFLGTEMFDRIERSLKNNCSKVKACLAV